jgi:hypothetical protein
VKYRAGHENQTTLHSAPEALASRAQDADRTPARGPGPVCGAMRARAMLLGAAGASVSDICPTGGTRSQVGSDTGWRTLPATGSPGWRTRRARAGHRSFLPKSGMRLWPACQRWANWPPRGRIGPCARSRTSAGICVDSAACGCSAWTRRCRSRSSTDCTLGARYGRATPERLEDQSQITSCDAACSYSLAVAGSVRGRRGELTGAGRR